MNKSTLTTFIDKYNLNSVVESVQFTVKNKVLSTAFVAEDKSLAGSVVVNAFDFEDCEFGIFETVKFKNFLKVLEDEITLTVNKTAFEEKDASGKKVTVMKPTSLTISDTNMEISFMLSDLSVIPAAPKIKCPTNFDVEIPITSDFTSRFVKGKNALPDVDNFTLLMNKKGDKLELVIGYASINSNRIKLDVQPTSGKDKLSAPINFNANYFRDILLKNADCTGAVLKIASAGIAQLEFKNTDFTSTYYLIQKKIED